MLAVFGANAACPRERCLGRVKVGVLKWPSGPAGPVGVLMATGLSPP